MFTLYLIWDFIIRVVCERECEDSRFHWRPSGFREKIREKLSHKVSHVQSTWLECEESWQLVFASNSWLRPSTMSSLTLFIPSLLTYCKECFSERKPQILPLRVRDYHTHNHPHNPLWFSSTPISPYPYPWEVDSPNTYHTQFECKVRFWCC